MRELPAGGDAILLDLHTEARPEAAAVHIARTLRSAVDDGRLAPCDVVAGAETVLVETSPGTGIDQLSILRMIRAARDEDADDTAAGPVADLVVPTVYDGADLDDAAHLAGVSPERLIRAHSAIVWRVQFMGFAPGFGYLVPHSTSAADDVEILARITRRPQSRPSVPAGSVAVAAGYSAVYPRASPGGWFLLGRTEIPLWDSRARPPAALRTGVLVRFADLGPESTSIPGATPESTLAAPATTASTTAAATAVRPPAPTTPRPSLTVCSTGPLTTVQDHGRPGFAHLGVPRSGAADLAAFDQANRLVGNRPGAAALEVTLGGWSARATGRRLIAVTGPAVPVSVDGVPVGSHAAVTVDDGAVVTVGVPARGCRNYVAVRGGFRAEAELGSCATDVLSGLGPAPVREGDVLPVGDAAGGWPTVDFVPVGDVPVLVELVADPGPRHDRLVDVRVLAEGRWTATPESNRVGVRLERPEPAHPDPAAPYPRHRADLTEMRSEGVPLGGVQIPPTGRPVIFLADHPTTGGYPVVAVLTPEARWRAAQLTAGDAVRLILR